MKLYSILLLSLMAITTISWKAAREQWLTEKKGIYSLIYASSDKVNLEEYRVLIENGIKVSETFFGAPFKSGFSVYVHPDRHSLDSTWQKDWNMPEFKSECWMVASGVGAKLDMISPLRWDTESCEHKYTETQKTQQLITHELVHVYHGQLNKSPDFSDVEGVDWFVEGLATFVSGQCDAVRMAEVKKAVAEDHIPASLDNFWSGKLKYGLSGSMVMYIDSKYGRAKLKELLPFNKKLEILVALNISESDLINNWKAYLLKL